MALFLACGEVAQAQAPMSAIDWLSDSIAEDSAINLAAPAAEQPAEQPATGGGAQAVITVTPLDDPSSDAVGLLPVSVTGLPGSLWGASSSADLARQFAQLDADMIPALQGLLFTLLLAELEPPTDSDPTAALFLARIDTLLSLGAVEQAQALLDRAGADTAAEFRRWFDASLLTGTEDQACERLRGNPDLSPTLPVRIFCLARGGDWEAALLTLETGRALGEMTGAEDALLTRFLDAESFEDAPPLPAPSRPTPLEFRLYEAIGEALPTANLPLAFAHTDLGPNNGWKAQIVAAERLARSGAIADNLLLGLYTERLPAASGGVWDRVAAIQRFERALASREADAISAALPEVWGEMSAISLDAVFARLYAGALQGLDLTGTASALAFRIGLISPDYEAVAKARTPLDAEETFLIGLARGDLAGATAAEPFAQAILDGFNATAAPELLTKLVASDRLGAAVLSAIAMASDGARGDLVKLTDAIALFRAVGLEDVARRTGLQILILDRRG